MATRPFHLAVLASGAGTNLQAIIDAIDAGKLQAQIKIVISNNRDAGALERAKRHGIPALYLDPVQFSDSEAHARHLLTVLGQHETDLVVLAGYIRKVPYLIIQEYRNRVINIHPALLPAFGGKGMYGRHVHEAVIEAGVKLSGVTVHICDEVYDHGPIIAQRAVPVMDEDTPDTLAERVRYFEHELYPEVLQMFVEGRVRVAGRKTYIHPRHRDTESNQNTS